MAALVAGAIAQPGDRPALLAAVLADRHRAPGPVIAAALVAFVLAGVAAALGGALLQGELTPEAGRLFLGLALGLQGAGGLFPAGALDRLEGWRLGAFGTACSGLFILAFADGLQFVVLALAATTPMPWTAAAGAAVGAVAVVAAAALLGERAWSRLPLLTLRRAGSALFLLAGAVMALQGLRLV